MATYTEGNVTYTVTLETKQLLENSKRVQEELKALSSSGTKASKGIDDVEKSAAKTGNTLGKLSTIAKAVSAALLSSKIVSYAESWNELEDRIANTGLTAAQTKDTLNALLATSDRNGRSINETSELYIRLSNSMKELGYSTQGTLDYIDTFSNLLTINKTGALQAESAINALTKAQLKGKLSGLEANTVFAAMPSILKTLGNQLNKTEQEVRALANDGQLSMKQFTDAMISAQSETAQLADNMRNNVGDAFNRIENNLKRYLGEMNNATGGTKLLVDSLILVSQNVDVLVNGLGVLAAIYAGKYINSLAAATGQSALKTISTIKQSNAERQLAQEELKALEIEGKQLTNRRAQLIALKAEATSKFQLASINKQLNAISAQRSALVDREAAAQARLANATKLSTVAMNGLKGAMSLLGGPAGILLIAAGALMTWASNAAEARERALSFTESVDSMKDSLKNLTINQLLAKQLDFSKQKENIKKQIKDIESEIFNLDLSLSDVYISEPERKSVNERLTNLRATLDTLVQSQQNVDSYMGYVNTLLIQTGESAEKASSGVKGLNGALSETAAEKLKELKDSLKGLADPLEKENSAFKESAQVLKDSLAGELLTQGEYDKKSEQLEKQHQLNLAKIRADNYVSQESQAVAQIDPVQALMNEHTRKLALIKEFQKQTLISEQQALELREAANHQYEQNRINAQWEIWRNQSDANEFLASSIEALGSSVTSTMSGLLSGTMSATEAMQNFANVILNEAIGSLVQMGVQQVKNTITSQAATAAATATQISEAIALETAWTGAAIQASIATQGAAATTGQASYIGALGTMRAAAIAGGREHGGTVAGNSMYRVGEGGKPEVLMSGGRQYLIPGENGRVLSNREITSNSRGNKSGVTLNFNMPIDVGDSGITQQDGQQFAKMIEQMIKTKMQEELRPGGIFNRR